jgi:hypothetical protein
MRAWGTHNERINPKPTAQGAFGFLAALGAGYAWRWATANVREILGMDWVGGHDAVCYPISMCFIGPSLRRLLCILMTFSLLRQFSRGKMIGYFFYSFVRR